MNAVDETKKFLTEAKDRATAETPSFWKKVQIIGAIIGGVGTLIVAAPFSLPIGLISAGTYLITVGGTLATISQFAKK